MSSIQLAQPADHSGLSLALNNLTSQIFRAAEENINAAIGDDPNAYTALERRAMVATEALRLTNGMDLAAILSRGDIISQIEREGLTGVHPNGYANLTQLAQENGISTGELSDTRAMCEVIFPYITNVLGQPLAEVWTAVGKSGMREMVPALRALITGEAPTHQSVRTAVETMLNNATTQLIAEGMDGDVIRTSFVTAEEDMTAGLRDVRDMVRRSAIETLLNAGMTLPSRELRRTVRPPRTPPVEALTLDVGRGRWFTVLQITSQEQYDMVIRLLGDHANNMVVNARGNDTREQVRTLRSFFGE